MRNVGILTGFLGSGKTTLLNRLLVRPGMQRAAVLVNEFGTIGIDHDLLRFSTERVAVLENGCICCAVREDIEEAVRVLVDQETSGEIEPFEYLFVETSGLADPAQLIRTFVASPVLASRFRLSGLIAAVDSVRGVEVLDRFPEAERQVALADLIVLTKTDLLEEGNAVDNLKRRVRAINVEAQLSNVRNGEPDDLLVQTLIDMASGAHQPLFRDGPWSEGEFPHEHVQRSESSISTFSIALEGAVDWTAFALWLSWLLHRHGSQVLRMKGILWVKDCQGPVVLHTVQHMVYPPEHLSAWPGRQHSRLVFIVEGLDQDLLKRSMAAFGRLVDLQSADMARWSRYRDVGVGASVNGRPIRRPSVPGWMR